MGVEIYPVFKPQVPSASFDTDGKQLLREHAALDKIARGLNLRPLSSYGDNREIPDDFDGDPDELKQILGKWDEWFSIDDGIETIAGLASAIKNDQSVSAKLNEPEPIRLSLEELAKCLWIARKKNARFRLEIG